MTSNYVTVSVGGESQSLPILKVKTRVVREFLEREVSTSPVEVMDNSVRFISNSLFGDATQAHTDAILDSLDYDQLQTVFLDCLEFNGLRKSEPGEAKAAETSSTSSTSTAA